MSGRPTKDLAASVRQRLLNYARGRGDDFQRVLTRYAIERLLFRLGQTEAVERYVLKGAMLLVTWPEHTFRPTGDLDLLGGGDPDPQAVAELFARICQVPSDDGLTFDLETLVVQPMREDGKYPGLRLAVQARLGAARIPVLVDIGFGDHVYPKPEKRRFPPLLDDLPAPAILMYPAETVVAEKFEAMIRFGETNGRIKDFLDIWITTRTFRFELERLVEAVAGTLKRRETPFPTEIPAGLTALRRTPSRAGPVDRLPPPQPADPAAAPVRGGAGGVGPLLRSRHSGPARARGGPRRLGSGPRSMDADLTSSPRTRSRCSR